MAEPEIAGFQPESYEILHPKANRIFTLSILINVFRLVQAGLRIHDSQLQTMVDAALRRRNASARVSISDNASRLTVDLVPLDEQLGADIVSGPFGHACDPRLVLILSQPAPPEDPADRLAKSLGLTTTEAQIALAMADGKTLAEISETRRTSIHTVRNQLKSLLLKTGTRRQSEVVALVERLRRSP